jgi:hypothetical protein
MMARVRKSAHPPKRTLHMLMQVRDHALVRIGASVAPVADAQNMIAAARLYMVHTARTVCRSAH